MNPVAKVELELALDAARILVDKGLASKLSLEWEEGKHPQLTYTSTVPLEFVYVEFTVQP